MADLSVFQNIFKPTRPPEGVDAPLVSDPDGDGDNDAGGFEEIGVEELFAMLVALGIMSVEEAEAMAGADLDGGDAYWEVNFYNYDDNREASAGANPAMARAIHETLKLTQGDNVGQYMPYGSRDAKGIYEHLMGHDTKVEKAVGGKYKSKHLSTGGNWVYEYASTAGGKVEAGHKGAASSTGSGAVKRSDNAQKTSTTSGQYHKGTVGSTGLSQKHNNAVKTGASKYRVRAHNEAEARKVGKLIASGKLKKKGA